MSLALMWIFALASLAGTIVALQFMPDTIPMHFDFAGNVDRWGSKWEALVFPAVILLLAFIWTLCIKRSLKNAAVKAAAEASCDEEGQKKAVFSKVNAKTFGIVAAAVTALLALVNGALLRGSYSVAVGNGTKALHLAFKIVFALLGAILVVLGNFMPKTRINGIFGVRVKWSVYNDSTWKKANRFGGLAAIATGLLIVAAAIVFNSVYVLFATELGFVAISTIVVLLYARTVYLREVGAR